MAPARMAVVYDCLFPFTTGGGERQYRAFAEDLAGRGIPVEYLTSRQWAGTTPEDTAFRPVAITPPLRLYSAGGVRRTAAAAAFAWGVFRALVTRRRRYDAVIVSALPVLNVFAARLALLGSGTVLIADYLEVWGRRQWAEYAGRLTGTIAWVLQRVAIAVTPTATCHSQLTARRLRAERFRGRLLVSPGLIADRAAEPHVGARAEPPFALYAGRHIPDKRVETIPAAVRAARASIPDLELVILGDGPGSPAVRAAVAASDAEEWTTLPGFVTTDRLEQLMSEAACLVNPSRREGYGLVVVEAAAHGTPVVLVADEGNAATELVEEGVNGYVAASASAADLGNAIAHAVDGGEKLRRTTSDWYREAVATRTIARTVDAIIASVTQDRAARRTRRTRPTKEVETP